MVLDFNILFCVCVQAEDSPPRYDDLYSKWNRIITVAVSDWTEDNTGTFNVHILESLQRNRVFIFGFMNISESKTQIACGLKDTTSHADTAQHVRVNYSHVYTFFNVFEHVCNQEICVFRPLHVHLWHSQNSKIRIGSDTSWTLQSLTHLDSLTPASTLTVWLLSLGVCHRVCWVG